MTQFVRVPPYEILVCLTNFIFFCSNEIMGYGVKSVLPFSKFIIGKSRVFSACSYVDLHGYSQIRNRGTQCAPPVLIGLKKEGRGVGPVKHYVERLVLLNIMQEQQRRQKFQGRI